MRATGSDTRTGEPGVQPNNETSCRMIWTSGAICPGLSKGRQEGLPGLSQQNKKAPFAEGPEGIFQCTRKKVPQEYHAINGFGEIILVRFAEDMIRPEKAPDAGGSSPETGGMSIAPALNLPGNFPRAKTARSRIIWMVLADAA